MVYFENFFDSMRSYKKISIFAARMKIVAFILATIIFSMAVRPCEDCFADVACINENQAHFEGQSKNHSQEKQDGCTTFCICQCCGTPFTIPMLFDLGEILDCGEFSYSEQYSFLYSFDYSNGIWRPPSLS